MYPMVSKVMYSHALSARNQSVTAPSWPIVCDAMSVKTTART